MKIRGEASCSAPRRPVDAIIVEQGRANHVRHVCLDDMKPIHKPCYGCGKCQTAVPCEHGIPARS